jgi:CRISPR/Cas system-associated endoribonuclease Cas2
VTTKKLDEDLEWAKELLIECSAEAESLDELCERVSSYHDEQIEHWVIVESSRNSTEEIERLDTEKKVKQDILDSLCVAIKQVFVKA